MSNATDHFNSIAVEALSLSAKERGDLAARLLRSLDRDEGNDEDENIAIVMERLAEHKRGESESFPIDQVVREMREKYGL